MRAETVLKRIESIAAIIQVEVLTKELEAIRQDIRLEQIKAGKIREIEIQTQGDGPKTVDAIPYGEFIAIIKTPPHEVTWNVVHIPTRVAVYSGIVKTRAIKLARYLSQIDIDISSDEFDEIHKLLFPFRSEIQRIVNE